MVTDPLAAWWVHTVTVQRHVGVGPEGDLYEPSDTVIGYVDDETRLVAGANGEQLTASSTLIAPLDTPPIPPRSLVTLPSGRPARVLTWAAHTAPGLDLPEHVEVTLQ